VQSARFDASHFVAAPTHTEHLAAILAACLPGVTMFLFLAVTCALFVLTCISALWLAIHCMQSWADFIGSGFQLDSMK
jgi:hypothetical protein